jgi:hypothetical protein
MTATDAMTKGDSMVERGAVFLEGLAQKAAAEGGLAAKLAEPLADDAVFLRKLKPSLIAARLRGEEPAEDGFPAQPAPLVTAPSVTAPSVPAPSVSSSETSTSSRGDSSRAQGGSSAKALAAVGAAFVTGIFVAKLVDWRGHAHPKD